MECSATCSDWLNISSSGSPAAVPTEADSDFKRFQQIAKEQKERERLLAEQQEQRRREMEEWHNMHN